MQLPLSAKAGFLVLTLGTGACSNAPTSQDGGLDVVDSAGVELVRNLRSDVDTTSVELVESLRIGTVSGSAEEQFHLIRGIAVDSGGRLFVIDYGSQAVRVFSSTGEFIRRFGESGNGPGQFTSITGLAVWRDTVHVINASNAQATFFDTSGVHVLSYQSILPDGSRIRLLAGGARGWFAADDSLFSRRAQQRLGQATQTAVAIKRINPAWIQTAVVSRSAADSLLTPIVTYRGPRIFGMLGSEGGSEQFVLGNPPFFEPSPSYAIDDRNHVYVAPGWPYVIDVYDLNGALIRRITRAHDSLPVTDDLKAEVLRRARTFYDSTSQQRGATYHTYSERAKMPVVGFLPVIRSILASSEGWIWVRRMDTHDDPAALESPGSQAPRSTAWDIFEPTGRFWATVRLPPRFSPFVVFPDAVVGVQRDELDIEYIVRYDLIGPRGDVP